MSSSFQDSVIHHFERWSGRPRLTRRRKLTGSRLRLRRTFSKFYVDHALIGSNPRWRISYSVPPKGVVDVCGINGQVPAESEGVGPVSGKAVFHQLTRL